MKEIECQDGLFFDYTRSLRDISLLQQGGAKASLSLVEFDTRSA